MIAFSRLSILYVLCGIATFVLSENECHKGSDTCVKCIQIRGCVWCKDPTFSDDHRCFHQNSNSSECDASQIVNVKSEGESIVFDENAAINPQSMNIKLRKSKNF